MRPPLRAVPPVAVVVLTSAGERRASSRVTPAAMTEIGGQPLLWHLMMHFATQGLNDFVVSLNATDTATERYLAQLCQPGRPAPGARLANSATMVEAGWSVQLVDGQRSLPLGLNPALRGGASILSRADSLIDIDLEALLAFHRSHNHLGTVVTTRPATSPGRLHLVGREVVDFIETSPPDAGWVSTGFFVLEPAAFDFFNPESPGWEQQLIERLTHAGELMAHKHEAFWHGLATPADRRLLDALWHAGSPPWKNWG